MKYRLLLLATASSSLLLGYDSADQETGRRGFFRKIRDAYIEGRLSNEEKRIVERKEAEKMRRRFWFERNVNRLTDGFSKRLRHRRSTLSMLIVGGFALGVWLCHKGSIGCERSKEKD